MGSTNLRSATRQYLDWVQKGGPKRTGLDTSGFKALATDVNNFRKQSMATAMDVEHALELWDRVCRMDNAPSALVKVYIISLSKELSSVQQQAHTLQNLAGTVRAQANIQSNLVESALPGIHAQKASSEAQIAIKRSELENWKAVYAKARRQLEGFEGFGNGFLTGITAGIYNPVKNNMEAAAAARRQIPGVISTLHDITAGFIEAMKQIAACMKSLPRLKKLEHSVRVFQNLINGLSTDCQAAHQKIMHAEDKSDRLRRLYISKAEPAMDALNGWKTTLQAI